ncbi:hypothetical protein BJV78DRAFT_1279457 [Lactifluus subvellereus]|nr:hypothetical protein BJV78DRAFT_1279457 [Lactifluus subvellereus]
MLLWNSSDRGLRRGNDRPGQDHSFHLPLPEDAPYWPALRLITLFACYRWVVHAKLDYSEEAVYHFRTYLSVAPLGDSLRHAIYEALTDLEEQRSQEFGVGKCSSDPELVDLSLFSSLASLARPSDARSFSPMAPEEQGQHYRVLNSIVSMADTDVVGIDEAVKYRRLLYTSLRGNSSRPIAFLSLLN